MQTVNVLVVDDDRVDVALLRRAFQRARIGNPIHVAEDGLTALEMLRGTDDRPPLPRPYIILLDLRMPRMDGHEFLTELRADPTLRDSVVFVLTTSASDSDRQAAYQRNVAGYIVKNDVADDFMRAIRMLEQYWRVVQLP